MAYDEAFLAGLEWMWGEGFMSPGGPAEVAGILDGVTLQGRRVLDIGCGVGGVDFLLLERYGAAHVTGIDVEAHLVERARAGGERRGLGERLDLRVVPAGPLPFDEAQFDVVFTKDSIIHVSDKLALFREVHRVLRPAGLFVGSDWLGAEQPPSPAMREWLVAVHLDFVPVPERQFAAALGQAGFDDIVTRDRNAWYREVVREEIASVSGDNYPRLVERIGAQAAEQRLESSRRKQQVVDGGELRPTHFRATRP